MTRRGMPLHAQLGDERRRFQCRWHAPDQPIAASTPAEVPIILVVPWSSSMNTQPRSTCAKSPSVFSAARAAARQADFSATCRALERDLVAIEETPDRRPFRPLSLLHAADRHADGIQRQVRLRSDGSSSSFLRSSARNAVAEPGLASTVPVIIRRLIQRIAVEAPMSALALPPARSRLPRTSRPPAPSEFLRVSLRHRPPPHLSPEEQNLICPPEGIPLIFRFTSDGKRSS